MSRIALAVADFALPVQSDSAPRLAVLERLLARGRRSPSRATSWRHWILAQSGFDAPRELPLGSLLARREGCFALATPMHLLAGLEHVHLDTAGPPRLSPGECEDLARAFNAEFAQDGLSLDLEAGIGLLSVPRPIESITHDPHSLPGREAGAWLPGGPDGGWLRRTMTAIEMWLNELPFNRRRESSGQVPVNGLWIWGTGREPLGAPSGGLPELATDDVLLHRAWERFGRSATPLPESFDHWAAGGRTAGCLALSLSGVDPDPCVALEVFESRWLAPIAAAVGSRRGEPVEIFLGDTVLEFSRADLFRFWRRPRAWHEALR